MPVTRATALIATQLLEFIRDGERVAVLMDKGKQLLGIDDVLPGVPEMVHEVQVEGTFPDGTKLVTVHQPICREAGDAELARRLGEEHSLAGYRRWKNSVAEDGAYSPAVSKNNAAETKQAP